MAFTAQNFVDGVGPLIKAAWLNGVDQVVNNVLSGNGTFNQAATGNRFQPSATIHRMNDRVFIGGATKNDGTFPPVGLDWLSAYEDSVGYTNFTMYGKLCVLTDTNSGDSVGITVGAQTLTFTNAGQAAIGIESFAVHNNATYNNGVWAFYGEAHKRHATGVVYAMEIDVHTGFLAGVPTPYQQGDTVVLQLADGAGVGGCTFQGSVSGTTLTVIGSLATQLGHLIGAGDKLFAVGAWLPGQTEVTIVTQLSGTPGGVGTYQLSANLGTINAEQMSLSQDSASSAACQIQNNVVPFDAGIVFGQYALAGCDGVNGVGVAIAMAKGHAVQWFNPSQQVCGQITSTVATQANGTKITFTDNGLQISNVLGGPLAYFFPVPSSVNYLAHTAGATGTSPIIQATGTDNNVDLDLRPGGAVATASYIKFGLAASFVADGVNTVTISNVGPSTLTSATIGKWLKIKDNAGSIWGIPLWALSS